MNFLKMGKDLLKGDKYAQDGATSGGSSSGLTGALKLLKQFDRDGDGNITEHGRFEPFES